MSTHNLIRLNEIATLPDVPVMERDAGQEYVLNEHILPYLADPAPDHVLVLAPSPAFGKTRLMAQISNQLSQEGKHVFWAMPRHDMFPVLQEEVAKTGGALENWMQWKPRNDETCRYPYQSSVWLERGNSLFHFCKAWCGLYYMQNECVFHAQNHAPKPIVCGHHNHVFLGHPLMESFKFDLVVGDEYPDNSVKHNFWVPKWHLHRPDTPKSLPIYELLRKISELPDIDDPLKGKPLFDAMGGVKEILSACKAYVGYEHPKPFLSPETIKSRAPDFQFYDDFVRLIQRDIDSYGDYGDKGIFRVVVWGIYMLLKLRRTPSLLLPKHIVWLDATPEQTLYERVFERPVKIVRIEVPRIGKVYQVATRRYNVTKAMRWNDDLTERLPTELMTEAILQVDHIVKERGYEHYAVASYKAAKLPFSKEPDSFIHFGGNRGTNALRGDSDAPQALFVIGTPQPPQTEIEYTAHTLWQDRSAPFDTRYSGRPVAFEGTDYATHKWDYYHDKILQAVLWTKRDAELIQTAHRAGLNSRPVDVFILTSLPIKGLYPDEILTIKDIFVSPYGISYAKWQEIVGVAEGLANEKSIVTTTDLAERLGVTIKKAWAYMQHLTAQYGWSQVKYIKGINGVGVIPKWEVPDGFEPKDYYSLKIAGGVVTPKSISKTLKMPIGAAQRYFDALLDSGHATVKIATFARPTT